MDKKLTIRGLSTISPLGATRDEVERLLQDPAPPAVPFRERHDRPVFPLNERGEAIVKALSREERFLRLDRVAHLAIGAAQSTLNVAGGRHGDIGLVSIGSSRGATIALEDTIAGFVADSTKVATETSPTTTAGNISSWVAQEVLARRAFAGRESPIVSMSTSMTCSSAFQSLLTSVAFIQGGLTTAAIFGGSEACLTAYTIAHLEALRIYADGASRWPCRPCGSLSANMNTVALGEGAGTAILMEDDSAMVDGDLELLGIGWAVEETPTATGLSADGRAFECAMRMASKGLPAGRSVDVVVAHAPGSIKGDQAEVAAIVRVFGESVVVTSSKHLTGHTYGASGMVSLAMAQALLEGAAWSGFPYPAVVQGGYNRPFRTALINTAGFGGNSVSVIVGLKGC